MIRWFTSAKRLDVLERELAALRSAHAELETRVASATASAAAAAHDGSEHVEALARVIAGDAERTRSLRETVATLITQVRNLEERNDRVSAAVDRLDRFGAGHDQHQSAISELRTTLVRLEKELEGQGARAETAVKALLERIETLRDGRVRVR